jgi:hypothetical protein
MCDMTILPSAIKGLVLGVGRSPAWAPWPPAGCCPAVALPGRWLSGSLAGRWLTPAWSPAAQAPAAAYPAPAIPHPCPGLGVARARAVWGLGRTPGPSASVGAVVPESKTGAASGRTAGGGARNEGGRSGVYR